MITKAELGRRIRQSRTEQGLTLKKLDEASGFSATHISEIERGKTSPTIGALIRIAGALGKEPSFFIEENLLPETSQVAREQRETRAVPGGWIETLSPGIPAGRLNASLLRLAPGDRAVRLESGEGEEGGLVVQGRIAFSVGNETFELSEGDAIHHGTEHDRSVRALGGAEASILLVSTYRPASPPTD